MGARVARFDEMLGEIVSDMQHVARGGVVPATITAALLDALADRLGRTCGAVHLPAVKPLWPAADGAASENTLATQRAAARAAIALDTLMSAAEGGASFGQGDGTTSQLYGCLQSARDSGDAQLAAQARKIHESLKQYSTDAFAAWARLAVAPDISASSSLAAFWRLANDEVPPSCGWSHAKFANKGAQGDSKPIPVPVQASPFVAERLTLGARRALEMCGTSAPPALISALKTAIGESLVVVYEAEKPQLPTADELKRSGMYHYLQWLFDLSFLRIALSAAPVSDIGKTGAAPGAVAQDSSRAAYNEILALLERTEAVALSDPVDRTLYQPVLKSAVKIHVQEVRILLGPFFQHNSLYGVLFPALTSNTAGVPGNVASTAAGDSAGDGFEIQQAAFALPLRSTSNLPRFPLLPFASASSLAASSAELDARLGLSADSAQRAAALGAAGAAGASAANTGAAAVSALTQQVGSALGSLGGLGQGLGLTKGWSFSSPQQR